MSCSPSDLKDNFFGELSPVERGRVEQHVASCPGCREELERLRLTRAALATLGEEEPPRRIAFVSDKVFEPKWWQVLWNSGPRLGFASALLVAIAIFAHGLMVRPVAPPAQRVAAIDQAAFEARVAEEVAKRLPAAVEQAVARNNERVMKLVADSEKRMAFERRADLVAFEEQVEYFKKRLDTATIQLARAEGGQVQ